MTCTLWHGCTGQLGVTVVKEDVFVCCCCCMPTGSCLHPHRGPEKQDLIWRVPLPLFPTLCMLHCQEGGGGGDLWLFVCVCEYVWVSVSRGPVLSTLHYFDCHDIMCFNTVIPLPPRTHTHSHTLFPLFLSSSKVPHINKGLLFCECRIFGFSSVPPLLFFSI